MARIRHHAENDTHSSEQTTAQSSSKNRNGSGGTTATVDRPARENGNTPRAPFDHPKPGVLKIERWLINRLLDELGRPSLRVILWNGESVYHCNTPPRITITIHDRRTLWKLIRDPFFQFGEAYSEKRLELDGDLIEFLRVTDDGIDYGKSEFEGHSRFSWLKRKRPKRNTLNGSKENIHRHYDLGNDFYQLWLDEQMLYTCAYFEEEGTSLEAAQIAKMDHVCRKLWLQPGETVVEAGCGWGAFALHMARHYGVSVRAFNISREQIHFARERARREGLEDKVEFIQRDWREIDGECDAFVSIGMLEHVGRENYEQLGRTIRQCLKPDGRALLHSIGQNQPLPFDRWIERRIFPGAYPPTLAEMMTIFEPNGFSVLDVENIRLHYAETLWHWLHRFEQNRERVEAMFDERFVRAWRLYLAGSFAAFEAGRLQLFQVLFGPEKENRIPRTRHYQYLPDKSRPSFDRCINPQAAQVKQNGQPPRPH